MAPQQPQKTNGKILVSSRDRSLTSSNGADPMELRRAIHLLGPLARVTSKEKRAALAGVFIAQNDRPNRQQRQAMKSKRGRVRPMMSPAAFHGLASRVR
jgi:hypothetical protein